MTKLEERFWAFHAKYPEIYHLICIYADNAIKRGYKKFSIKTIIERVRWEQSIVQGKKIRIANAHTAYYARLWLHNHPDCKGFFKVHALPSKHHMIRMEYPENLT